MWCKYAENKGKIGVNNLHLGYFIPYLRNRILWITFYLTSRYTIHGTLNEPKCQSAIFLEKYGTQVGSKPHFGMDFALKSWYSSCKKPKMHKN